MAEEAVLEGNNGNGDKKLPIIVSLTLKTGILLSGGQSHPLLTKLELTKLEQLFSMNVRAVREEKEIMFHIKPQNLLFCGKQ